MPQPRSIVQVQPPGMITWFARMEFVPSGWLYCNGSTVNASAYPDLYNVIGTYFGGTPGSTFVLPDLRAEFIRGLDQGRGVDPSRIVGTGQSDAFYSHNHTFSATINNNYYPGTLYNGGYYMSDGVYNVTSKNIDGTDETRPRNYCMLACIKY